MNRRIADKTVEHDDLNKSNRQLSDDTKAFFTGATQYHVIINNGKTLETKLELTNAALSRVRNGLIELPGTYWRAACSSTWGCIIHTGMRMIGTDVELTDRVKNHAAGLKMIKDGKVVVIRRVSDESDILNQAERKRATSYTQHGTLLAQKEVRDD